MEFKCTCHNSGTNSFTGKCSNCGMVKPSQWTLITNTSTPMEHYKTLHEAKVEINPPILQKTITVNDILKLERYDNYWETGEMLEDLDGEYIKLEDVLNLIGAKKE